MQPHPLNWYRTGASILVVLSIISNFPKLSDMTLICHESEVVGMSHTKKFSLQFQMQFLSKILAG